MADPELNFYSYSGALHLMFNPVIYLFIAGATTANGYCEALRKAGIEVREDRILKCDTLLAKPALPSYFCNI